MEMSRGLNGTKIAEILDKFKNGVISFTKDYENKSLTVYEAEGSSKDKSSVWYIGYEWNNQIYDVVGHCLRDLHYIKKQYSLSDFDISTDKVLNITQINEILNGIKNGKISLKKPFYTYKITKDKLNVTINKSILEDVGTEKFNALKDAAYNSINKLLLDNPKIKQFVIDEWGYNILDLSKINIPSNVESTFVKMYDYIGEDLEFALSTNHIMNFYVSLYSPKYGNDKTYTINNFKIGGNNLDTVMILGENYTAKNVSIESCKMLSADMNFANLSSLKDLDLSRFVYAKNGEMWIYDIKESAESFKEFIEDLEIKLGKKYPFATNTNNSDYNAYSQNKTSPDTSYEIVNNNMLSIVLNSKEFSDTDYKNMNNSLADNSNIKTIIINSLAQTYLDFSNLMIPSNVEKVSIYIIEYDGKDIFLSLNGHQTIDVKVMINGAYGDKSELYAIDNFKISCNNLGNVMINSDKTINVENLEISECENLETLNIEYVDLSNDYLILRK